MPDSQPDPEDERQAARWPLRLSTTPGYFQSQTAYSGVSFLRRREGAPCCILHPQEAGARPPRWSACTFAQRSRLDRARPQDQRRSEARCCPRPGQRPNGETVAGTINILISDRYPDIGGGATYQSTRLDVTGWPERAP